MEEGVDILITNLNKLKRMQKEKRVSLKLLQVIVFDEADVIIEIGQTEEMVQLI